MLRLNVCPYSVLTQALDVEKIQRYLTLLRKTFQVTHLKYLW